MVIYPFYKINTLIRFFFIVLDLENNRYTRVSIRTHYHDSEPTNAVVFLLCAKRSRSKYQHSSLLFDPIDRGSSVLLFLLALAANTLIITPSMRQNDFSVDYCHSANGNKLRVKFEDTKKVIISQKSKKDRQCNFKKRTTNDLQNTTQTED